MRSAFATAGPYSAGKGRRRAVQILPTDGGIIDLRAFNQQIVHVSGTGTVTKVLPPPEGECFVIFDGACVLTHNATSLILPSAANITTEANATAIVCEDTSGNARFVNYTKASGLPLQIPFANRSTRTSDTTLTIADAGKWIDATSGTYSQTFAASASLGNWAALVGNSGTGFVTLDPNGAETITVNGSARTTWVQWPGEIGLVTCDGSNLFYTCVKKGEITQVVGSGVASVNFSTGLAFRRRMSLSVSNVTFSGANQLYLKLNSTQSGVYSAYGGDTTNGIAYQSSNSSNAYISLTNNASQAAPGRLSSHVNFDIDANSSLATFQSIHKASGVAINSFFAGEAQWQSITDTSITDINILASAGTIDTGTMTLREL